MNENILTSSSLFGQLFQLCLNNDNQEKNLGGLIKHVTEIIRLKLKNKPNWLLSEFLALVLVCSLLDDLKIEGIEKVAQMDLIALQSKFEQLYEKVTTVLAKLSKKSDIQELASPVTWLELIFSEDAGFYDFIHIEPWKQNKITFHTIPVKENLVPSEIVEHIWFHHFKLDPMLEPQGLFVTDWLNYSDAAAHLKIPETQLIGLCLQKKFGAYIPLGDFDVYEHHYFPITKAKILEIHDPFYPHFHDARGRLLKPHTAFTSKETLKKLYDGSCIGGTADKLSHFVFLQPSLAEAIKGIIKCVCVPEGQGIGRDNLLFSEAELNTYLSEKKSSIEKNGVKKQRMEIVINALDKLINIANENDITIDKKNMYGTKKEFGELLQMVNIKLKSLSSTTIIENYLKPLGYNFKAGTHPGKCEIFKKIKMCVLNSQ